MHFLALRRAMRHQSKQPWGDTKEFFGLLLDTSAQVSDFSPPLERDPSMKTPLMRHASDEAEIVGQERKLFPPVFEIDTMDAFAPQHLKHPVGPNQGDEAFDVARSLYTLGRPLWGSLLRTTSFDNVVQYAMKKVRGQWGHVDSQLFKDAMYLSWMAYRLNFYIALPILGN